MKKLHGVFFLLFLWVFSLECAWSQSIPAGSPVFEEALRRKQLLGELDSSLSFHVRPLKPAFFTGKKIFRELNFFRTGQQEGILKREKTESFYTILPLRNTLAINTGRPYGWGNNLMIPNVGVQNYTSGGVSFHHPFFQVQFQPELVWAQNKSYAGFPDDFSRRVNSNRFIFWNFGDSPERFGEGFYARLGMGQSKVSVHAGSFELGLGTENIWWGPGQFNGLIFSNNAQGFPHLTLNTTRPAKTFLGSFEGQLIIGQLRDSGYPGSQHPALNDRYFKDFKGGWRYLNGVTISYQPKWVPGLFVGGSRTFHSYNSLRGNTFADWFPVFNGVVKTSAGLDLVGESDRGRDQQIAVYTRYVFNQAKAEVYFEYGRRDHAYTWKEFLLNPEHARAYLMGFNKLFALPNRDAYLQVRGEMTQQQESINRIIRYTGGAGATWHTHSNARGFAHKGQALGVGTGLGSNVQTLEIAYVEELDKLGIVFERVANHEDFYYRAFGANGESNPWVDLSMGFLLDYQWDRFLLSSKLQFINAKNYQWQLEPSSTPEIPIGKDKFSVFFQTHFVYLF